MKNALAALLLVFASLASADERFDLRSESLADDAAKNMDGLVSWRVEGLGAREELRRPGSLFGTVGLSRPFGAGFDVRQNPHVLGGLAPQVRPEDRPAFLDLYGNNGQLVGELPVLEPDSPSTTLRWGRYGFSGNSLELDFSRMLTDSVTLGLNVLSISSDSALAWEYQAATHQLFLSAFGRDSSQIPFTGRALKVSTWEFAPWAQVRHGRFRLTLHALFSDNSSDEAPAVLPKPDKNLPYTVLSWKRKTFEVSRQSTTFGARADFPLGTPFAGWVSVRRTTRTVDEDDLVPYVWVNDPVAVELKKTEDETRRADELLGGTVRIGDVDPAHTEALPWPALRLDWEFRDMDEYQALPGRASLPVLSEDRELGAVEWTPALGPFKMTAQWGWSRISDPEDERRWSPASSADLSWSSHGFTLRALGFWRDVEPTLEQRYVFSTGRVFFPNRDLGAENRRALQADAAWESRHLTLETGIRHERATDWIGSSGLEALATGADSTLSDTLAFGIRNWESAEALRWHVGGAVRLGNWEFALRRHLVPTLEIEGDRGVFAHPSLPRRHWSGHLLWQRRVLRNKALDLSMKWNWQWIGPRTEWAQDPDANRAVRTELGSWLALDFEARMRIRDFQLYYRVRNMNDDKYFVEPGYTPTGISFQYGICWALKG